MREILQTITVVDARDIPSSAMDWLIDNEVSVHYQNDIVQVSDDGNAFAEWLKSEGYVFKSVMTDHNNFDEIGILAT